MLWIETENDEYINIQHVISFFTNGEELCASTVRSENEFPKNFGSAHCCVYRFKNEKDAKEVLSYIMTVIVHTKESDIITKQDYVHFVEDIYHEMETLESDFTTSYIIVCVGKTTGIRRTIYVSENFSEAKKYLHSLRNLKRKEPDDDNTSNN